MTDSIGGPFPRPLYPSIEAPTDEPVAPLGLAGKGGRLYGLAARPTKQAAEKRLWDQPTSLG